MGLALLHTCLPALVRHSGEERALYAARRRCIKETEKMDSRASGNDETESRMDSCLISRAGRALHRHGGMLRGRDFRPLSSTGQAYCRNDAVRASPSIEKFRLFATGARLRCGVGLVALLLALLLTACGDDAESEPAQPDAAASPAASTAATEADGFITADSMTGGGDTADAHITNIRFGRHDTFERLVIDFATEQSSATALPQWQLEKAAAAGVLRVHLPTVVATAFTDGDLAGDLLTQVFVVRATNRSLFVDVFIPASFRYRVLELSDPLRLVIDVAAEGTAAFALPATDKSIVLNFPRAGATLEGSVTVSGYSRHFEANNVIILQDSEGSEIARTFGTSADYVETWGYFSLELAIPNRPGAGSLHVGDFDAQDGSFKGVTVLVQIGGS